MPFDFWKFFDLDQLENDIISNFADVLDYGEPIERRAAVGTVQKLGKIEVYSDHNPPHFHITGKNIDYKFTIENLDQIKGDSINSKQMKDLKKWYFEKNGKEKLITFWQKMNPQAEVKNAN